jgi:hypothetical protein
MRKSQKLTTEPLAGVGGYENPRGFCFDSGGRGLVLKSGLGGESNRDLPFGRLMVRAGIFWSLSPIPIDQMVVREGRLWEET